MDVCAGVIWVVAADAERGDVLAHARKAGGGVVEVESSIMQGIFVEIADVDQQFLFEFNVVLKQAQHMKDQHHQSEQCVPSCHNFLLSRFDFVNHTPHKADSHEQQGATVQVEHHALALRKVQGRSHQLDEFLGCDEMLVEVGIGLSTS